jgi:hypothetical protein
MQDSEDTGLTMRKIDTNTKLSVCFDLEPV